MHTKHILALAAAFVLFGCTTVNQSVAFNEADFRPYDWPGTAVIRGHAFVRTESGRKENAAGLNVYLVPLTPYTAERANIMAAENDPAPPDPRLARYVRTDLADNGGAFEFTGLPAGSYVVYCEISWWRRHLGASGDYYVVGRATVADGERKHLVVTNNSE